MPRVTPDMSDFMAAVWEQYYNDIELTLDQIADELDLGVMETGKVAADCYNAGLIRYVEKTVRPLTLFDNGAPFNFFYFAGSFEPTPEQRAEPIASFEALTSEAAPCT